MSSLGENWNLAEIDARLERLKRRTLEEQDEQVDPREWVYVNAASVLGSVDPSILEPLEDPDATRKALARLLEESIPVFDSAGHATWRLKAKARRGALARLGGRDAILQTARSNPSTDDALQRVFLSLLEGQPPALDGNTYSELATILEVTEALSGLVAPLPPIDELRAALERAALFRPLRELVDDSFRGREKELDYLGEYVSLGPSRLRLFRSQPDRDLPLLIHGVGGIGKSTLLGKFILERVTPEPSLIFAYLDFDRPTITATDPRAIVVEMARQLAVQARAGNGADWRGLVERWSLAEARAPETQPPVAELEDENSETSRLIGEFARCYADSFDEDLPFLVVFDTFEVIQERSAAHVGALWRLIDRLRRAVPALRPALVGRAPIDGLKTESLELTVLDREAAVGFLHANGIGDPETAEMIVERVGSSPLTLKLAADFVRREEGGAQALSKMSRRQRLALFSAGHETAQVELYRRILHHMQDPNLQKLAHPGLVLRRITPELIKDVLADPCQIEIASIDEARELFEQLRSEVTLVRVTDDGALEHRGDVRRAMLPMMRKTEPAQVQAIHQAAIDYFSRRPDASDRAEEIYHRLALGQDPAEVEARWLPGVEDSLRRGLPDLPARAQGFLASRLGVEIDPKIWRKASEEDRELHAERRARELLDLGQAREALAFLSETRERTPASRLYLYEAQAQFALGDFEGAAATVDNALRGMAPEAGNEGTVELFVLGARIASLRDDRRGAVELIDEAYKWALWIDDAQLMLTVGARRPELWRSWRGEDERGYLEALASVHLDIQRIAPEVFAAHPAAAHQLAGQLGGEYPQDLVRIAATAGLPPLRPERVRRAVVFWNRELRGRLDRDAGAARIIQAGKELSAVVAMDTLLGLLERHDLTDGAAGQLASEIRHELAESTA